MASVKKNTEYDVWATPFYRLHFINADACAIIIKLNGTHQPR